jgi:hypothetical protein
MEAYANSIVDLESYLYYLNGVVSNQLITHESFDLLRKYCTGVVCAHFSLIVFLDEM